MVMQRPISDIYKLAEDLLLRERESHHQE